MQWKIRTINDEHWITAPNQTKRLAGTFEYAKALCDYLNTGKFPNENHWKSLARKSESKPRKKSLKHTI